MKTFSAPATLVFSLLAGAAGADACDLCACTVPSVRLEQHGGWRAALSGQYTEIDRLERDGHGIANPAGQYLHSSIAQAVIGYDFTPAFGLQLNVPLIYRTFRRVEDGQIDTGSVGGLGDVSLLAHWVPLRVQRGDFSLAGRILGGVKFPTGDSDRVAEEGSEGHEHAHEGHEHGGRFAGVESGVHGHDLALGTGSLDAVVGAGLHVAWQRFFVEADVQYMIRGQGEHGFRFANDLQWSAGPGVVLLDQNDLRLALQARFAGDTKGEDHYRGERLDDTASTVVSVGPRVSLEYAGRLNVDIGFEKPIRKENSGTAVTPDYRISASVGWQF